MTSRRTRPVGRLLRLTAGAVLLLVAIPILIRSSLPFVLPSLLVLLALAAFFTLAHIGISRGFPDLNRWVGAVVANVPVILLYVLGSSGGPVFGAGEGQLAAITYVGIALVLAAVKADPGCEVMSVPSLILREHTHLACIAFTPTDWIEERLAGR